MSLPGEIQSALPSVPGFDCDTAISAALAQQFFAQGYKFCFRYLSTGLKSSPSLSEQEAIDILNSGLGLMPVQHANRHGWLPNKALGEQDGQEVAANAHTVGFPDGVSLWCDLEGVSRSANVRDVIDYCEAWHKAVNSAGYRPGLYVGAGALLTGRQLHDLPFRHYWRSQGQVPDITKRGYQVIQLFPFVQANGVWIDLDMAQNDREGGAAQWLKVTTGS